MPATVFECSGSFQLPSWTGGFVELPRFDPREQDAPATVFKCSGSFQLPSWTGGFVELLRFDPREQDAPATISYQSSKLNNVAQSDFT